MQFTMQRIHYLLCCTITYTNKIQMLTLLTIQYDNQVPLQY